jgi:diacylglycerol O-acyltransferase
VNDVVLAMCGAALRRYLSDLGQLPEKPLIAMVPVSLRRDESDSGNQVAMVLANLGTHIADPGERLATIVRSVRVAKERFARMTPQECMTYSGAELGLTGLNIATGIAPSIQAFNVVISNVPGPRQQLYFHGARVDGAYPVSIVVDGQALNITLTSYRDKLAFGLVACRRTLPHMQQLLHHLEEGIAELEQAPAGAVSASPAASGGPLG